MHVNANSEALRHNFVKHEGKKTLVVNADSFVLGNPNNDWPSTFVELTRLIDANSQPGAVDRMTPYFSTSSPLSQLAARVAIMDTCQAFFNYVVVTRCGFPRGGAVASRSL